MVGVDSRIPATGHLTLPDAAWEQARLRTRLISELAERDPVGLDAADRAAVELGISRRRVYVLLQHQRIHPMAAGRPPAWPLHVPHLHAPLRGPFTGEQASVPDGQDMACLGPMRC